MKKYTDKEIIAALRAANGYSRYAAQRLDCPEDVIWDRIRTSPQVGKVYWGIRKVLKRKKAGGTAGKTKFAAYRRKPSARLKHTRSYKARADANSRQCGLFDHLDWLSEPWNG